MRLWRKILLGLLPIWFAACGSNALAAGCSGWLNYPDGVAAAPLLEAKDDPQARMRVSCSPNEIDAELLTLHPALAVLATAKLHKTAQGLELDVAARRPGAYVVGQRIRAPALNALDSKRTRYAAGAYSNTERFYPYNWRLGSYEGVPEQTGAVKHVKGREAGTVPVDLALPGIMAGRLYFVQASNELSLLKASSDRDHAEADLLSTWPANGANGDSAITDLPLHAGDNVHLAVLASPGLRAIEDAKWGRAPPMAERLTDIPYKSWSEEGYNLSPEVYRTIAARLAGGFDGLEIRTLAPEKWIPEIFHRYGLRVYLYQYWGAVRVLNNAGTLLPHGVDPAWALRDTGDPRAGYTGPTVHGAWQMLDVRRAPVRAYLVDIARKAVADGWDGVSYDGPYFWADSNGRVGGAAPPCQPTAANACLSFAYARAMLLEEVKNAIRQVNPAARLGILAGIRYVDELQAADYVDRENVNMAWTRTTSDPLTGEADYSPHFSKDWLQDEAPFIANNLFLGGKSANPLIDKTAIYWADRAPKNIAIDIGDFWPQAADEWSRVLGDVGHYFNANRIVRMSPTDSLLHVTGVSLLSVPRPTTIVLEHPAPAFDVKAGRYLGFTDTYELKPGGLYVIAERPVAGQIHYSGERFAWFANDLYLAGNIRFDAPPQRNGNAITLRISAIDDGSVSLWSPVLPKAVLADGRPVSFARGDGGISKFVVPKPLSTLTLAIEF